MSQCLFLMSTQNNSEIGLNVLNKKHFQATITY